MWKCSCSGHTALNHTRTPHLVLGGFAPESDRSVGISLLPVTFNPHLGRSPTSVWTLTDTTHRLTPSQDNHNNTFANNLRREALVNMHHGAALPMLLLATAGWQTIKGAWAMRYMQRGYKTGLIRYVIVSATKPLSSTRYHK